MPAPVVLFTISSDSHSWNLVYLELLMREHGHPVVNLGACTPLDEVASTLKALNPHAVVVSTVNGHGLDEGRHVGRCMRASGWDGFAVIGGKLSTTGSVSATDGTKLQDAGFDAVSVDGDTATLLAQLDRSRSEFNHGSDALVEVAA